MPFDRQNLHPVVATFYECTRSPSQAQLDFLVVRHGVPHEALGRDGDGEGFTIGTADVVIDGPLFDFADAGDAEAAPR